MGKRRQARELALQFLYGYDMNRKELSEAVADFWQEKNVPDEMRRFAGELIDGTIMHLDQIDKMIADHAQNWKLPRLALVDKHLLRLALFELCYRDDIPPLVTIDEAVEIAKKYSTAQSGRFINGILDKVREELEAKE